MLWVTMILAAVPAAMVIMMSLSSSTARVNQAGQMLSTKGEMQNLADLLVAQCEDVDGDSQMEPLKEAASNRIPASIAPDLTDEWGNDYYYCTWDPGTENTLDVNHADNNVAPPINGMLARILSSGPDKTIDTACADITTTGDDLVLNISEGTVMSSVGALAGWKYEATYTHLINNSDNIAIGTNTTSDKLYVLGDATIQNDGTSADMSLRAHGYAANINSLNSGGSLATPTASLLNDGLLKINAITHNGSDFNPTSHASIDMIAGDNFTGSSKPSQINVSTTPSGSTAETIAYSILSSGDVSFVNGISVGSLNRTPEEGAIQWNGTNLQVSDGTQWINLEN